MEGHVKKFQQVSPERAKVWTERSPKYQQIRKVPIVYYLCKNRQLEHPHFIEVPLSSPDGLCLKDVIDRLNVLRGKGMASMYSWSCKRLNPCRIKSIVCCSCWSTGRSSPRHPVF